MYTKKASPAGLLLLAGIPFRTNHILCYHCTKFTPAMTKRNLRLLFIALGVILIVVNLYRIDYASFTWSASRGTLLNIGAMLLVIAAMFYSMKREQKQR